MLTRIVWPGRSSREQVLRSLGRDWATFPASLAAPPPAEWIMATPVGGPHYFIRRSWRDLAAG
jgi:hypothetical protein